MKRSNCDWEERWQGVLVSFERRGQRVPLWARLIRRHVEIVLRCAEALAGV